MCVCVCACVREREREIERERESVLFGGTRVRRSEYEVMDVCVCVFKREREILDHLLHPTSCLSSLFVFLLTCPY